jgi:threonine dehydratase
LAFSIDVKKQAVRGYGGKVIESGNTLAEREEATNTTIQQTGGTFIHPSNDPLVIAGQGTAAIELLQAHPDLDAIFTPGIFSLAS